jgi:dTDP-4-amino-4,6-dideoxygalactose transaminase
MASRNRFYRVPLCVPFWSRATYRAILRSLLTGSVTDGPDLAKLKTSVSERLGIKDTVLCGSGKLALEVALRACHVGAGDQVVIPTICCTSVLLPIFALGAVPVFADVGDDLNLTAETVEAVWTEGTKAVIVPHLFGNPAAINAITEFALSRGMRVIDDAAQAFGAAIEGRPVGSFGDAGVLSFGEEKVCFGIGGGIAVSRESRPLKQILGAELAPARFSPAVHSLLSTLIRRRWRRWTLPLHATVSRVNGTGPDSPPVPYTKEAMANLNAAVALSLVETVEENVAARRARVDAYRELLGGEERLRLVPHRPGSACLTQVVQVVPGHGSHDLSMDMIQALGDAGFEIQGSYVPIHLIPRYRKWARKRLRYAENVWEHLVELPCEPEVRFDHVERIASIVRQVIRS